MSLPILVAGIGNIFHGDDAFGCAVVEQLRSRSRPDGVKIVDFGIRGFDLAYALMDEDRATILVDATPQGGTPGDVYTMQLSMDDVNEAAACLDAHALHPLNVLRMVKSMGGTPKQIFLVGCEPADLGDEFDGKMGLSPEVDAAIELAVARIEELVSMLTEAASAKVASTSSATASSIERVKHLSELLPSGHGGE